MIAEDVAFLVSLCRVRAGLRLAPDKTYLMESRLGPIARREGFASIGDLLAEIRAKREEPLIWAVVEALAMGETAFFRDRAPFDQFRDDVLPMIARARAGKPVRVWSAACATGQEIYSLAMIVDELRQAEPALKVELAASDLSSRALERAQAGAYNQFEVQRGLPIRLLVKHFEKTDDAWRLKPYIRQMVRWRRINLIAGLQAIGGFDVVFCRNVLSAMDDEARKKVLEELTLVLPDDGVLVLGARETVSGVTEAFHPIAGRPGLFRRNPSFHAAAA
ncbi:MAG: CheR family methyltransferase [Caulobacterales bacterium]